MATTRRLAKGSVVPRVVRSGQTLALVLYMLWPAAQWLFPFFCSVVICLSSDVSVVHDGDIEALRERQIQLLQGLAGLANLILNVVQRHVLHLGIITWEVATVCNICCPFVVI